MQTLELQRRLAALGFDPGPQDSVMGRLTQKAIEAFQASRHLEVDGIVGPKTLAALLTDSVSGLSETGRERVVNEGKAMLSWIDEAKRLQGLKEGAGAKDNATILQWADDLDLHYPHDSIAWCGLFTSHCIAATLPDEPLPTNPLGARNFLKFGVSVDPQLGAVLVFWRTDRVKSFNGHVGFYNGEDGTAYHVLGGNQADSVSIARVAKDRLLGARWPKTAPFLATGKGNSTASGGLSTNEA